MIDHHDDLLATACPGCGADESECSCDTIVVDDPDAPHTCVYVATPHGDHCEVCGQRPQRDEFAEMGVDWDRAAYDFEGGAG